MRKEYYQSRPEYLKASNAKRNRELREKYKTDADYRLWVKEYNAQYYQKHREQILENKRRRLNNES